MIRYSAQYDSNGEIVRERWCHFLWLPKRIDGRWYWLRMVTRVVTVGSLGLFYVDFEL